MMMTEMGKLFIYFHILYVIMDCAFGIVPVYKWLLFWDQIAMCHRKYYAKLFLTNKKHNINQPMAIDYDYD